MNFTDTNFPLFWKIFYLFVSLIYEIFFNKFEINLVSLHGHVVSSIFHITYSVIQRFPALRKAITTHMKKYRFFSCVSAADWQYQTHLKKIVDFSCPKKKIKLTAEALSMIEEFVALFNCSVFFLILLFSLVVQLFMLLHQIERKTSI